MIREAKIELNKMLSLIDRMENHYTGYELDAINEGIEELDARGRVDIPVADFPSEIKKVKGGTKCTIGYVSSAKLDIPQIKKKNPDTNRMKNYDDWETFGKSFGIQEEIGGVIKFTRYSINWRSPENMRKHYNKKYVEPINGLNANFGLQPIEKKGRQNRPQDVNSAGEELFTMQDTAGGSQEVHYYLMAKDGHIIKELEINDLIPYFKKYSTTGVAELRKMNASDDVIKDYVTQRQNIEKGFRYTRFNYSSIAYAIATIGGVKKRFFNDELSKDILETGVNPDEFLDIARKMYKLDLEKTANDSDGEFDDEYPDEA